MSFAAPLFLAFVTLAAIPLVLHLFGRDRAKRRPFAALSLLLQHHDRVARKNRLRHRVLLAVRIGAVVAVPLLLAKPFLLAPPSLSIATGGPQSAVIVIDDSLSMRAALGKRIGRDSSFARAKSRALELVDSLADSEVAVLVASRGGPEPLHQLTYDRRRARDLISALEPSHRSTDATHALARAAQLLEHGARPTKRIYLFTDAAAHAFAAADVPPPAGVETIVIDVTDGAHVQNRAITALDTTITAGTNDDPGAWQIDVEIASFGTDPVKELPLVITIDGVEVSRALLELAPGQRLSRRFVHHPSPDQSADAAHLVTAELAHDALPEDDIRYARLEVTRPIRVLVVDGDPHVARRDDEVFYLETALAMHGAGPIIQAMVVTADDARRRSLDQVDVLFLCNVADPPASLHAFVRRGGGLFISLGDRVSIEEYNRKLGDLLPRPLASLRTTAEHADLIGRIDRAHPVLAPFSDASDQSLASVRVSRYALLSPGGRVAAPIFHESGAPLLIAHELGKGRVLLYTSTIDRDWSTLAIAPAFLPLVQSATLYLAGASAGAEKRAILVGDREGARTPGLLGKTIAEGDVVNVDPQESDLTPLPPERLAKLTTKRTDGQAAPEARRVPLWPTLGGALLLLLLAEALVLARR